MNPRPPVRITPCSRGGYILYIDAPGFGAMPEPLFAGSLRDVLAATADHFSAGPAPATSIAEIAARYATPKEAKDDGAGALPRPVPESPALPADAGGAQLGPAPDWRIFGSPSASYEDAGRDAGRPDRGQN